jgi:hypothetical protein
MAMYTPMKTSDLELVWNKNNIITVC